MLLTKGIAIFGITFDKLFRKNELMPKLGDFFDNCLAPEVALPIHVLGTQVHDLHVSQ